MRPRRKPRRPKPTEFGALLSDYLTRSGMSQRSFSEAVGRQQSVVSRIIVGKRRPNTAWLPQWARVLKLNESEATRFVELGTYARAMKVDSTEPISDLRQQVALLQSLVLSLGRKAIERGAQLDDETLELLNSLEQR